MTPVTQPVRILHLDDSQIDAQLVEATLHEASATLPTTVRYVRNEQEYREALNSCGFDVILSDYRMPGFDGEEALTVAQQCCPELPFIMVTGELGEERVIEMLHKGATDYVLKDRMFRLVPAIERALEEAQVIKDRREAERQLKASEERYRRLVAHLHDAILVDDVAGRVVFANDRFLEIFGITREDLATMGLEDHVAPEFQAEVRDRHERRMRGEQVATRFEYRGIRKDGGRIWLEVSVVPLTENGRIIGTECTIRDITERKEAEAKLHESEERFRMIQDASLDGFTILRPVKDAEGKIIDFEFVYLNDAVALMSGSTPDQMVGKRLLELLPGLRNSRFFEAYCQVVETGKPTQIEEPFQRAGGDMQQFWLRLVIVPARDTIAVLGQNVTARKQAEAEREHALQESERQRRLLHGVIENAPIGIAIFEGPEHRYIIRNASYGAFVEGRGEVVGRTVEEVFPEIAEAIVPMLDDVYGSGKAYHAIDEQFIVFRGEELADIYASYVCAPWFNEKGETQGIMFLAYETTDQVMLRKAAQTEHERLLLAEQAGKVGIFDWDLMAGTMAVNSEFGAVFGLEVAGDWTEIAPDLWKGRVHPDDKEEFSRRLADWIRPQGTPAMEWEGRAVRPSGETRWVTMHARLERDPLGDARRLAGTVIDITELKRIVEELSRLKASLEERVRARTQELELANRELQSFSYTVSHDLKAPLRMINGFTRLLETQDEGGLSARQRELLELIQGQVGQMDRLIKALLEFSKVTRKQLLLVDVDTRTLAEEVINDQKRLLGEGAAGRVTLEIGDLPVVHADPVLLRMVFANLLSNAFKFTQTVEKPLIRIEARLKEGFYHFRVADNGVGFPKGETEKLFNVFQRLHSAEEFEGSGIGLANVRKIIERHGGQVCGEGEEGKGAAFFFTLPADTNGTSANTSD